MTNDSIPEIINTAKTIAIVGLSPNPLRDSYEIAEYLLRHHYKVIPVNPKIEQWNGVISYPDLLHIDTTVDVVDIFRRSEYVPEIVEQAIAIGAKSIWMQLDVINEKAARRAEEAGLRVVMDRCISVEHRRVAIRE